jgi:hypothetical protein
MSNLILCLSGKKRSGKNTAANFIAGKFLKRSNLISDFKLDKEGKLNFTKNSHWSQLQEGEFNKYFDNKVIKMYSFADPLKEFCMDVFGLTYEQCYGNDEQKNSLTNIRWDSMPLPQQDSLKTLALIEKYKIKNIYITSRELLQYFGTQVIRSIFSNAWVNATISKIKKEQPRIALITDARFPNEIEGINPIGGKTIRLLRNVNNDTDEHYSEKALDNYTDFTSLIDNREMSIEQQCNFMNPMLDKWFLEAFKE